MVRAAHARELSQLSAPAQAKLKICLLDFLSCAFEARDLPTSRQAVAVAARLPSGSSVVATSVAFPAISAGVFGWEAQDVARIGVRAVTDFLQADDGAITQVRFVLFSPELLRVFEEALG